MSSSPSFTAFTTIEDKSHHQRCWFHFYCVVVVFFLFFFLFQNTTNSFSLFMEIVLVSLWRLFVSEDDDSSVPSSSPSSSSSSCSLSSAPSWSSSSYTDKFHYRPCNEVVKSCGLDWFHVALWFRGPCCVVFHSFHTKMYRIRYFHKERCHDPSTTRGEK